MTKIELDGYGIVDVADDASVPLNFNIQNLLDASQTPSSFSKDITLIGSKNNNLVLGQAFDVNIVDSTFNVNKKVRCNVTQGGANVFSEAFFQLIKVTKGEMGRVTYVGRVKSNLMSFFTDIKDKVLEDLRITKPEDIHTLGINEVTSTFNRDYTGRWKYIPHYNQNNDRLFFISDFKPAVFAKTYWDEIHAQSGWDYEFDELAELHFDKLIIPTTNKYDPSLESVDAATFKTNPKEPPSRKYIGTYDGDSLSKSGVKGLETQNVFDYLFPIIQTDIINNPNGGWSAPNQEYTPTFFGNYTFEINFDYIFSVEFTNAAKLKTDPFTDTLVGEFYFDININGQSGLVRTQSVRRFWVDGQIYQPGSHQVGNVGNITLTAALELNSGDTITGIRLMYRQACGDSVGEPTAVGPGLEARWVGVTNEFLMREYNPTLSMENITMNLIPELNYNYGTTVVLDEFVPKGIKQRDFIKSIIDMYKLVVEVDELEDNKLIYKTRNKYYDEGSELNWTGKIDVSKDITLEWLQDKQSKELLLTYKGDDDIANAAYTGATGEIYGQYTYKFENEYNVGTNKVELIFSPTPFFFNEYANMYLSMIDGEGDYNIRLLYDGGMKTNATYRIIGEDGEPSQWLFNYPMVSHVDNPAQPGFDLNFFMAAYYMVNMPNMTENNLFNLYHRRFISQLSKGRIMTAFFNLTAVDILNFKLNSRIWIKDSWWNVNRIIDYNANGAELTKVELVTVDDGTSINPPRKRTFGYAGHVDVRTERVMGEMNRINNRRKNVIKVGSTVEVQGVGNTINDGFGGIVVGNNNNVNGSKSMVIGNGNTSTANGPKLVVGDDLDTTGSTADVVSNKIEGKENVTVGNVNMTPDGIGFYQDDGQGGTEFVSGFEFDQDGNIIIDEATPIEVGWPILDIEYTWSYQYPSQVATMLMRYTKNTRACWIYANHISMDLTTGITPTWKRITATTNVGHQMGYYDTATSGMIALHQAPAGFPFPPVPATFEFEYSVQFRGVSGNGAYDVGLLKHDPPSGTTNVVQGSIATTVAASNGLVDTITKTGIVQLAFSDIVAEGVSIGVKTVQGQSNPPDINLFGYSLKVKQIL